MEKLKNIILTILVVVFTISIVPKEFQNDTYFTIAWGEQTLENGIQEEDTLTWHEGLKNVQLRWAFNCLVATLYNIFGFIGVYGLVIVEGIIISALFFNILNMITNKRILSFILSIVTMYIVCKAELICARGQSISYIVFLLEFYCIEKLIKTNKNRYLVLLMILPIILVNFHASVFPVYFIIYMPYLAEAIISKLKLTKIEKIQVENIKIKKILISFLIAIPLGFISPIGITAYTYMFKVMQGVSSDFIAELQEASLIDNYYFTIYIIVFVAIITFTKIKVKLSDLLFVVGFSLLAISTARCLSFFLLISVICIGRTISTCLDTYNIKISITNKKLKYLIMCSCSICIILFSIKNMMSKISESYVRNTSYPIDATNYILSNIDTSEMKIFNHFNFGSYLEFKGIKSFIDSRSEIFTTEFNEDCDILAEWLDVINGKENYNDLFDKYEITHVLLYNEELITKYIYNDDNYELIYIDENFSLYERVNN